MSTGTALRRAGRGLLIVCASLSTAMASETIIETPGPAGPLQGALIGAAPDAPTLVIVPGSGPTDRDGNNPLGVAAASYRLLAEALAGRGIASIRIDKRGMFGSKHALADPNHVTITDYASDVRAWVAKARAEEPSPKCVWVLGHSEGGLVGLAAAADANICGLILVAAPGRKLGDVLRAQLSANPSNAALIEEAFAAISSLEGGKNVDAGKLNPALAPLFQPAVQGFIIDAMSYDPAVLIAPLDKPVLILQGRRDVQVSVQDAERLKAAAPRAELVLLPDVNHVLKLVASDDRASNLATYANPSLPIAPGVVDAIAGFIERHSPPRR